MAKKKANDGKGKALVNVTDYRHENATRVNIPPAKIAAEGTIPKVQEAQYSYSPRRPPSLRFDPTGRADKLLDLLEEARQRALTDDETRALAEALRTHEPWLEWAGKREAKAFEVDPVALMIHERISTQAILRVAARQDVQRDLFADPQMAYQEAVQFYRHDMDWTNRLILGDSLQVMSSLARREDLAGKVQMIYMDPPYGIKFASNFQPEIGKRDVKDKEQDLTREPEMVKAYRDTWTLGVHSYLAYLRDRLVVARELLADTGSIFVQINDENLHRVRSLLDEVFGTTNFVSQMTFVKTTSATGEHLGAVCDYLLWYARAIGSLKFRRVYIDKQLGDEGTTQYVWAEIPNTGETKKLSSDQVDDYRAIPKDWKIFAADNCTSSRPAGPNEAQKIDAVGRIFPRRKGSFKTNAEGFRRLESADRLIPIGENLMYRRFASDFSVREVNNNMARYIDDRIFGTEDVCCADIPEGGRPLSSHGHRPRRLDP